MMKKKYTNKEFNDRKIYKLFALKATKEYLEKFPSDDNLST
jgi:hypothetical protein